MEQNKGRNNAKSIFGVEKIPSDNHIRDLLDEVEASRVFPVFTEILESLESYLGEFRSFNQNMLVAMDGTEYHGSSKISCPQCSSRLLKNETTHYFHSVITPVIVSPNQNKVIPLIPEFIVPQDGHDKQDCETAAAKRWVNKYGDEYALKKVTILGDDLYSRQPFLLFTPSLKCLLGKDFRINYICNKSCLMIICNGGITLVELEILMVILG